MDYYFNNEIMIIDSDVEDKKKLYLSCLETFLSVVLSKSGLVPQMH